MQKLDIAERWPERFSPNQICSFMWTLDARAVFSASTSPPRVVKQTCSGLKSGPL